MVCKYSRFYINIHYCWGGEPWLKDCWLRRQIMDCDSSWRIKALGARSDSSSFNEGWREGQTDRRLSHAARCVCYLLLACVGNPGWSLLSFATDLNYPPDWSCPSLSRCTLIVGGSGGSFHFLLSCWLWELYLLTCRLAAPHLAVDFTEVSCNLSRVGSILRVDGGWLWPALVAFLIGVT